MEKHWLLQQDCRKKCCKKFAALLNELMSGSQLGVGACWLLHHAVPYDWTQLVWLCHLFLLQAITPHISCVMRRWARSAAVMILLSHSLSGLLLSFPAFPAQHLDSSHAQVRGAKAHVSFITGCRTRYLHRVRPWSFLSWSALKPLSFFW